MALVKAWSSLNWDAPLRVIAPWARTGMERRAGAASGALAAGPSRVLRRCMRRFPPERWAGCTAGLAGQPRPGRRGEGTGWLRASLPALSGHSGQVPREERQRPLLRHRRVLLDVAAALLAAEAVARAGIHEHLDAGLLLADRLDVGHRDGGVHLAEVELHRAVRRLVLRRGDAAAVPPDARGEVLRARGAVPGDGAAPAVADDAAPRRARKRRRGGPDVEHGLCGVDGAPQVAALRHVLRRVAQLDAACRAVEQRRANHGVAGLGET